MNRFYEITECITHILAIIVIIIAIVFITITFIDLHSETKRTNDYYNCVISSKYPSKCKRW